MLQYLHVALSDVSTLVKDLSMRIIAITFSDTIRYVLIMALLKIQSHLIKYQNIFYIWMNRMWSNTWCLTVNRFSESLIRFVVLV